MIRYIFLFLYLFVGFVPYLGTIDKIGSQWLFLSIVNILFLFFVDFSEYLNLFKFLLKFKFVKAYFLFVLFSFLSIFYAINFSLSLVDFSRIITTFFIFYNLSYLFFVSSINISYLFYFLLASLFISFFYSYSPLIDFLKTNTFDTLDISKLPNSLKGFTGNKNVYAFSCVFYSSFIYYLLNNKNIYLKIIASFLLFLLYTTVVLLTSRAALLSLLFTSILYVSYYVFNFKVNLKTFILLIPPILLSYFSVTYFTSSNFNIVSKIQSISPTSDTSTNYRIILWENAIDYISKHPIIGCGIGNWKVESLPYWRDQLTGYTIPYHAHNDFLELSAETGLIGGLSYIFIFIFIFYGILKSFKSNKLHSIFLLSLFATYSLDAFVNFPVERALSQLNFALLLIFTLFLLSKNEKYIL